MKPTNTDPKLNTLDHGVAFVGAPRKSARVRVAVATALSDKLAAIRSKAGLGTLRADAAAFLRRIGL